MPATDVLTLFRPPESIATAAAWPPSVHRIRIGPPRRRNARSATKRRAWATNCTA